MIGYEEDVMVDEEGVITWEGGGRLPTADLVSDPLTCIATKGGIYAITTVLNHSRG